MPKGKTHDNLTLHFLPLVLIIFFFFGIYLPIRLDIYGLLVINSYLIGGYYFSPDLDIDSIPYKRWKFFRWIWFPYRKFIKHRSIFSHGIIIGTFTRLIYFFIVSSLMFLGLIYLLIKEFPVVNYLKSTLNYIIQNKYYFLSIFLAFELSAEIHIYSDKISSNFKKIKKIFIRKRKIKRI